MWGGPAEPADSYYAVRPECTDVPRTRFKIKPGKTLSARKWQAAFSLDGHLDIGKTLHRIQRGGIHPSIRGEVWEFLLACYDPESTFDERDQIRQHRRVQYARWKNECREIFPVIGSGRYITAPVITEDGQPIQDPFVLSEINPGKLQALLPELTPRGPLDKKAIQWLLTLHQIGLDVMRTDRTLVFYEKQENLSKLWDILSVYAWIDTDVGYGQGMSDLCSPMIILLEDEADAFWCFERLMRRLRGNFRCTGNSVGVEKQLSYLAAVTQVIDPKLHHHFVSMLDPYPERGLRIWFSKDSPNIWKSRKRLNIPELIYFVSYICLIETLGGGDYLFAFRMLMVLFRREFSFCDSLYLWEMMWALEYDPDLFSLYEEPGSNITKAVGSNKGKPKSRRPCGKYERENMKIKSSDASLPISVFLVASVLKDKSSKLLHEARGLDDVVKVSLHVCSF
ncbi:hypothetical protein Gohar_006193 [Gossypium harknessii]|uniref:Rab-GAP TBC domain-containing protein n=1 Tax=Gossypium harknessii TaxID=34285 RepID=A0A7J9GCN3_9ROSI|nr:hypothetical protein [Gossypium harknessii]